MPISTLLVLASLLATANLAHAFEEIDWSTKAENLRGQNERTFSFLCPEITAVPTAPVWGTDVYTDDSSICAAALHAGRITLSGGLVVIEILPGEESYTGSEQNGVATRDFGAFVGSFRILRGITLPATGEIPITSIEGFPVTRRVDNPPQNAIDKNLETFTWTTEEFNTINPSYLVATFAGAAVERIRLWKKEDGGGGLNIKDLTIEYTTDVGPIESRTWQPVTGLTNGFNGIELLNADEVNSDGTVSGDIHDSEEGDGWASLTFDPVNATGVRIGFSQSGPVNPCTGIVSGGACVHYRVHEIELY